MARRRSAQIGRLAGSLALAGLAAPLLSGCGGGGGVLDPIGPVGADDSFILMEAVAIMTAIIVPTILLAFWMAWRYRASNRKAEYLPYWSYSGRIEAVVWAIPILTIMFLGGVIWIGSYKLDPFRPLPSKTPPEEVQVVSLDWKWLFIYPREGVASVNQLVVPAGTPVHFQITSASVFNTFFIPRLGSMIYAMPGMVSQLNLEADRPAVLFGESGHFSGDGFSDMQFQVRSVSPTDFAAWAAATHGAGPTLDAAGYTALAQPSQAVRPYTYGAVDPQLFHAIATQALPPGPGPAPPSPAHAGREVQAGGSP
jgi:cytochrome o ubiquinol oxidase subunit 2